MTRRARSVFQRLGSPTASGTGSGRDSSCVRSSRKRTSLRNGFYASSGVAVDGALQ
jgi:hypothetical protein